MYEENVGEMGLSSMPHIYSKKQEKVKKTENKGS